MKKINDYIIENEGIIYKIINKYKNYFELDDLYQVAMLGLIKAYKKYDETYHTKFITYAYPYILGEVIKYINESKNIKMTKEISMIYNKIIKAKDFLSQKLMKEPSTYELSLFLELPESKINEIITMNYQIESLDKTLNEDNKNIDLYEKIGYFDQNIENFPINEAIKTLSKEEKFIIESRYYNDMSQSEIGKNLGMYQVEISRQEKKILKKIKEKLSA